MNRPWIESIGFEKELQSKSYSKEEQDWLRTYHNDGVLVLKGHFDKQLCDKAVQEIEATYSQLYDKSKKQRRISNIWGLNPDSLTKQIAGDSRIMGILKLLYQRNAIPFQTLNFKWGSEQRGHSDSLHFSSMPERFMCGAWAALEDTDEQNGTIFYYPGSHKLPQYSLQDILPQFEAFDDRDNNTLYADYYQDFVDQLIEEHQLEKKTLNLKKGDVVIWASNVVHGGGTILDENRTRHSQVTHYFFEDCIYYTPMYSNIRAGEYRLRKIKDLRTGQPITPSYNGEAIPITPLGKNQYSLSSLIQKKSSIFKRLFEKLQIR